MAEFSSLKGHPELRLNTVTSIHIAGLSRHNSGKDHELVIPRAPFLAPKTVVYDTRVDTKHLLREPPRPPTSTLPPPGDMELKLQLGDVLHRSNRNAVYKVNVVSVTGQSPDMHIPPLVLKVASEKRGRKLAEEGGMYNHLESLQGCVIPRCYGYFQTLINHTKLTVLPWDADCVYPRDEGEFDMFRMPNAHACLTALLLEEVGGPVTSDIPEGTLRSDFEAMSKELAYLGIKYTDWRTTNVMKAPQVPPGLPGTASSRQPENRIYTLRFIDFEDAHLSNDSSHMIIRATKSDVEGIIGDLTYRSNGVR